MADVAAGYLPILIFLAIALVLSTAFVGLPMLVSRLTGAHQPDAEKLSEYECGFPAFEDTRDQFDDPREEHVEEREVEPDPVTSAIPIIEADDEEEDRHDAQ